jgi:hypothetical protein
MGLFEFEDNGRAAAGTRTEATVIVPLLTTALDRLATPRLHMVIEFLPWMMKCSKATERYSTNKERCG